MIDREELLHVEISPLDEGTECLYFAYQTMDHFTIRYLYKIMLWKYYEKLNQIYGWGIDVEVCNASLELRTIRENALEEEFYELCDQNCKMLMSIGKRFGWEIHSILVAPDDPTYDEYREGKRSLKSFLDTYEQFNEYEKAFFLSYEDIFEEIDYLDGEGEIWILEHLKLGKYLTFRDENMAQIDALFKKEDEKIMDLVNWLGHPLFLQISKRNKREENKFLAAFICGYYENMDVDLWYLTPQWVIGSFVAYELLLHAEHIFGY